MRFKTLLGIFGFGISIFVAAATASITPTVAQSAKIDPRVWMVGEWSGSSQLGTAFTLTIDAKGSVTYVFGGKTLQTGPAEKSGDSVMFYLTSNPGHYIHLTPTGPNSGNWMFIGGSTVSRSTISRKT